MTITTTGKNEIRDAIDGIKDQGQLGTDDTAELESDSGLGTAVAATLVNLTSSTADQQLVLDYFLTSVTGNGNTFKEFENRVNAGVNLNRVTFSDLIKTSAIEMNISTIIFID